MPTLTTLSQEYRNIFFTYVKNLKEHRFREKNRNIRSLCSLFFQRESFLMEFCNRAKAIERLSEGAQKLDMKNLILFV